jgi:hypothetical protein
LQKQSDVPQITARKSQNKERQDPTVLTFTKKKQAASSMPSPESDIYAVPQFTKRTAIRRSAFKVVKPDETNANQVIGSVNVSDE